MRRRGRGTEGGGGGREKGGRGRVEGRGRQKGGGISERRGSAGTLPSLPHQEVSNSSSLAIPLSFYLPTHLSSLVSLSPPLPLSLSPLFLKRGGFFHREPSLLDERYGTRREFEFIRSRFPPSFSTSLSVLALSPSLRTHLSYSYIYI